MKINLKKTKVKFFNTRNVLIALILLVLFMLFGKYVTALVFTALFIPIGIITTRYGKIMPHVSPETITITSAFMGYVYGVKIGVLFAFGVGGYCYLKNSMISLPYLTVILLGALTAFNVNLLKDLGFTWAIALSIVIRNLIGLPLYMYFIAPNPPENIIHHTTHIFLNTLVYLPIFSVLYDLSNFF